MKVVIPDLVSNSYFPAIAAVEMGFFKEEGLDGELELFYPGQKSYDALRRAARRQGRLRRWFVAFRADRVSRVERREVPRRAGAEHLLVPDHAGRSEGEAWRRRRGQRQADRCRA